MSINPSEPQEIKRPRRELPEFPKDSGNDDPFGDRPKRSRGGDGEGFMATWGKPLLSALVIGVILAIVLSTGMTGLVTKSDDVKNWTNNTAAFQQIQSQLTNIQTNLDTTMTNVNNAINQVDEKVNLGVSSGLAQVNSELSGYSSKIDTLQTKLTDMQAQLSTLQGQVGNISTLQTSITDMQGKINTLNSQISTLQTTVNTVNAELDKIEGRVTALETPTTTTTTTTPATGTGIYATILGNPFTGMSYISIPAQEISTTKYSAFNFSLSNATDKVATEIQLAVALLLYDAAGVSSYTLPEGTIVVVNINGYSTNFTRQSTGNNSVLGYINAIVTGIFGSMANISQPIGVTNYTMTVTITTSAASPLPAFIIKPNVQVVSYK